MSQSLSTRSSNAGGIFSESRFLVPQFQREYAWGREEVGEFWSDLSGAMSDGEDYFLGLLIFTRLDGQLYVVDGQQRLLTLTLLANAIRLAALELGRNALAERVETSFLFSIDYKSDAISPRLTLSAKEDNSALRFLLGQRPREGRRDLTFETVEEHEELTVSIKIANSQELLWRRLNEDLDRPDRFERLGEWAEFISSRLYFAIFEHPDRGAAYKVFEVVNTRGKELTTADLVKSFVLSESVESEQQPRYERWTTLSDIFRNTGYASQFVQYVRHVITERHGYVLPRNLYDFISKNYAGDEGVEKLLDELFAQLPLYQQMMDPTFAGPAAGRMLRVFTAMELLDLRSTRPLMLAIERSQDPEAGSLELLRLAVRRIVVGNFGTGNIERRFSEAAEKVFKDPENRWEEGVRELNDLSPTRQDFQSRLAVRPFNKAVLYFLRSSVLQGTITPEIEGFFHFVRPRGANNWPGFPEDAFKAFGSTIGNTFIADIERRPNGSGTPSGFQSLLLPHGLDSELLTSGSFRGGTQKEARALSAQLAKAAAAVWYA